METPFISICIPAYKNKAYLQRLLESVSIQTFRDFEVIITDDSPDHGLEELVTHYSVHFPLLYSRNPVALGSPANWNQSIRLAKGQWIKIMHDDDWFADRNSLASFADAAWHTDASFIFSGFVNVDLLKGVSRTHVISSVNKFLLSRNPLYLFRTNYIGHPSTTLIRNNRTEWFDETIKWVVDIEFYIRVLRETNSFVSIKEPLIHIGVGAEQITRQVFRNPAVEIPENVYLLNKIGARSLKNIFVYDYFWRLIRNLKIQSAEELLYYVSSDKIPAAVYDMITRQKTIDQDLLIRFGFLSKLRMLLSFLNSR